MGSARGAYKNNNRRVAGTTSSMPNYLLVVWLTFSFLGGMTVSFLFFAQQQPPLPAGGSSSDCVVSLGTYHGLEYRCSDTIGTPKCLVESKFLKVQQHTIQMPSSTSGSPPKIIDDWLFIDYHDRINVLVEAPRRSEYTEPHFLVFEQKKYALEDRLSLAIVGGIIEPAELPQQAAEREVAEEMHLTCQEFHFLGRYRTDVNRGGGWTCTYLATHCKPTVRQAGDKGMISEADEVGVRDTERQDLQTIGLAELRKAVIAGKFLEIQWSATVALALLHPELTA